MRVVMNQISALGVRTGVGQYTHRQWRLEATSRGLLVIATLLVPLNFLVLAGLSPLSQSLWELAVKVAAVRLGEQHAGAGPTPGC